MTAATPSSRNLGLDLLRLVAILLVLGNHLRPLPEGHGVLMAGWMRGGWVGVDLFFVLSGFLVSGLLFRDHQRHGRVSIGHFLLRRGLKIYPAFWVLIVCSIAYYRLHGQPVPLDQLLGELLFVQNYAAHLWPHTWSLAIEEHFYLCLALVFWLLLRRSGPQPFSWIPAIFVLTALTCLGLRIANLFRPGEFNYAWSYFSTHVRIDSLFFGVLLAYLAHYHRLREWLRWFPAWGQIAAGLLLLLPAFVFDRESDRWVTVIGFNMFYVGSGLLVLGALHLEKSSALLLRVPGALGAASYSIYLWHVPVNYWLAARILVAQNGDHTSYWHYGVVGVLGALLFGYAMARVVELPILALRDRFYPSRSVSATPLVVPLPVLSAP